MSDQAEPKTIDEKIDEQLAETVAGRPPSDWDTFDQADGVGAPSGLNQRNDPIEPPPDEQDTSAPAEGVAWGDDAGERGRFFREYEEKVWGPRKCPARRADDIRKEVLKARYGRESLKGFNGDRSVLLADLEKAVEVEYPLAMAYFEDEGEDSTKMTDKPHEGQMAANPGSNGTPTQAGADSKPTPPLLVTEPPFTATFSLIHSSGVLVQFEIKAEAVGEGVKRVNMTIEHLIATGYRAAPVQAPSQGAQQSTSTDRLQRLCR
ncbi:MAG TPA: hypothetical protein VGQ71_13220 [Terriglobales bacterium]|jgi:hypothetical protein|nr:hypothetical protein [Terriglobales bacterium]